MIHPTSTCKDERMSTLTALVKYSPPLLSTLIFPTVSSSQCKYSRHTKTLRCRAYHTHYSGILGDIGTLALHGHFSFQYPLCLLMSCLPFTQHIFYNY